MTPIPVTLLTGYLGAGKTTLLNRILSEEHGMRYAVIVNEFGEEGIDNDLVVNAEEEIFEMNNGCICCTVRGDLIRIIGGLMQRRDTFDAILIETTGLADPAPVAQTFFVDQDVAERTRLDAIVTVVDAKFIASQLKSSHEAEEQLAFADIVLLNKVDLVDEAELDDIEGRIRHMNPYARIVRTERCGVGLDRILGQKAFDLSRVLEVEPGFLHDVSHEHDDNIKSVSLRIDGALDIEVFDRWFRMLLAAKGQDILRSKGILSFAGENERYAVQGVHMLVDGGFLDPWPPGSERQSRLVFIGRNLDEAELRRGFEACLVKN